MRGFQIRHGCLLLAILFGWDTLMDGAFSQAAGHRRYLMPAPIPRRSPERCEVTGCDRGSCNAVEGVCRCQYGFTGRTCNEYILRSCHFGPTDYEGWTPPVLPPGLYTVRDILNPVSCMCLAEVVEANGRQRGNREIRAETECFVRVPEHHVTLQQLMAMQHSGLGGEGDKRLSLNYGAFRAQDFLSSCSAPTANLHKPTSPKCLVLTEAYARVFKRPPWPQPPGWVPDTQCAKHVTGCGWGEAERATHANTSCCPAGSARCVGSQPETHRPTMCQCGGGVEGLLCERPCRFGCINACSGHGECFAGWCKCKRGWFGVDCSLSADAPYPALRPPGSALPPSPPPPKHVSELKVYVYDVPPYVLQAEPCPGCMVLCGGLYASNEFFLARLMRDPAHLTTNPDEAHLFYAPLLAYRFSFNLGRPSPHIRDTVEVIRDMGYFDRNGGRDHVWYVVGDIQTCQVTRLVRPGIVIGHWGRLDVWMDPNHDSIFPPCMDPHKDLVVPALSPPSQAYIQINPPGSPHFASYLQTVAVQQAQLAFADGWMDRPRPTLLFFAGSNRPLNSPECADASNNSPMCRNFEYAMGIRAAVFNWFRQHADEARDVEVLDHGVGGEYYPKLRSAVFCLEVPGAGFSVRIMDYMASGCIPAIVRDDILSPFESYEYQGDDSSNWQQETRLGEWDDLPRVHYPDFSVTFHKRDIPTMLSTLRGVSPLKVRALQAGVQRVHRAFLWDDEYGLAYNYTLAALSMLRAKMKL